MSQRTLLAEYLDKHDQTLEEFGNLIGATAGMISRYAQGKRYPSTRYAVAIAVATGGAVPASYWADLETKRASPVQKPSRTSPGRSMRGSPSVNKPHSAMPGAK